MVRFLFAISKTCYLTILFFLSLFHVLDATPLLDALIDSKNSYVNFPLKGTITITYNKEEKINPETFLLEGKKLDVSLLKEVEMSPSSDTWVSIYGFELPPKPAGFYILPSISVKINGKIFSSSPSSYTLHAALASAQSEQTDQPHLTQSDPLMFSLEASIEGPATLYPGERTRLRYRILYNQSVDLTRSDLPLVHPEHFKKVGDIQIKDYQFQSTTIQEITQEVEASELGIFTFGPSFIEGHAYREKNGQKIYDAALLKAQAPVMTLEVKPFPSSIHPLSFTGALGKIQVKLSLNSTHVAAIGDAIELKVEMSGITNLADATLPNLKCQPGFSGFFQLNDLPPLSEVKGEMKIFYLELIPLNNLMNAIPSIEFSSFDQESRQYVIQKTSPIPLKIQEGAPPPVPHLSIPPFFPLPPSTQTWPDPEVSPLEKESPLTYPLHLTPHTEKGKGVMWILFLAALLLGLQKYQQKKKKNHPILWETKSERLFKEALKSGSLQGLEQAFWHRLWEKGVVPLGSTETVHLTNKGELAQVHSFIDKLQSLQYGKEKTFESAQLMEEAKKCFKVF